MNKIATMLLGLMLAASTGAATSVEFSADSISVTEDGSITTYSGNVTLRVPAGTPIDIKSTQARKEGDTQVHEGDVQITVEDLVIHTRKAVVKIDGATIITMDEAELREPAP